jgi:hypothetical protein
MKYMQNVCHSDYSGDGTILSDLKEKWEEYIEKKCSSLKCSRRYSTRCCVWGGFKDSF